jgi:hypothetical protein
LDCQKRNAAKATAMYVATCAILFLSISGSLPGGSAGGNYIGGARSISLSAAD